MPDEHPASERAVRSQDVLQTCWRCGLHVPSAASTCHHCAASLVSARTDASSGWPGSGRSADSLNLLFGSYAVLLVVGIIHAFVLGAIIGDADHINQRVRAQALTQILVVEGIDTLIIVGVLFASWGKLKLELPPLRTRLIAWIMALPMLAALLLLNLGYHAVIRQLVGIPLVTDELLTQFDATAFLAVCVQPAVVEEVYCRLFALQSLQSVTGKHAAVWISALMFGFMHVAVLPSVPCLIVLGACLAYLRLASGTILLPILLHFVHNLVILLIECSIL
jgi:membrane protease YdiL (CAAX protease family)